MRYQLKVNRVPQVILGSHEPFLYFLSSVQSGLELLLEVEYLILKVSVCGHWEAPGGVHFCWVECCIDCCIECWTFFLTALIGFCVEITDGLQMLVLGGSYLLERG